jgi:hypothetical protein
VINRAINRRTMDCDLTATGSILPVTGTEKNFNTNPAIAGFLILSFMGIELKYCGDYLILTFDI